VNYFTTRVQANLQIMEQVDLIGRTSEFARVFGIEFFHVLSRGSQVLHYNEAQNLSVFFYITTCLTNSY
jgi:hypothetical protein